MNEYILRYSHDTKAFGQITCNIMFLTVCSRHLSFPRAGLPSGSSSSSRFSFSWLPKHSTIQIKVFLVSITRQQHVVAYSTLPGTTSSLRSRDLRTGRRHGSFRCGRKSISSPHRHLWSLHVSVSRSDTARLLRVWFGSGSSWASLDLSLSGPFDPRGIPRLHTILNTRQISLRGGFGPSNSSQVSQIAGI